MNRDTYENIKTATKKAGTITVHRIYKKVMDRRLRIIAGSHNKKPFIIMETIDGFHKIKASYHEGYIELTFINPHGIEVSNIHEFPYKEPDEYRQLLSIYKYMIRKIESHASLYLGFAIYPQENPDYIQWKKINCTD